MRILVVEDEAKVARAMQEGLEREEYNVVVARTGEEGFFLVSAEEFDLVILDLMLPGRDGLQVQSTLRKRGLVTPVLILTARDAIEDRVQGLDGGADDYLVKPFAVPELSRIRALLRRGQTDQLVRLKLADLEIHNAIKYSPTDAEIRVQVQPGKDSQAIVEVIDKGPGVSQEDQSRIFDRFYRVDKARSREWGGAGLGLAIARWAVEVHGGQITVESAEGEGSTFRITLPPADGRQQTSMS